MQNAAAYIRVSTDDQTEYSPTAQLNALKEYAKKNKIIILDEHIYVDEGISAKRANNRPGFQRMIKEAKTKPKPFDTILVHKFDRFSRNREDSVVFKSLLRKDCGIKVISTTEQLEDDKFSVILEAMLEAMAEYYSLNLADEVKKGQLEKAKVGGFMARPPYGYKIEEIKNPPVVIPEQAKIVKLIFDKFLNGWSYYKITKYLNEEMGVKTQVGYDFTSTRVKYIINNPMYCGLLRWNMRDSANGYAIKKESEWITADGMHEPIIDLEIFEKAQVRVSKFRKHSRPPEMTSDNIFSGLLRCGACGSSMSHNNRKYKTDTGVKYAPYYQCDYYGKGRCDTSHSISSSKIEAGLMEKLKKDSEGNHHLNVEKMNDDRIVEQELAKRQLSQFKIKLKKAKEAYLAGVDNLEEYKENKLKLKHEEEQLKAQIEILSEEDPKEQDLFREKLKRVYLSLASDIDVGEKKKIIRSVVKQITFKKAEKRLVIDYFFD